MNTAILKVSEETRQVIEHLFWLIEEKPENVSSSASKDDYTLFNHDSQKTLHLIVRKPEEGFSIKFI